VMRNTFGETFANWTEEEIADDFRDSEEDGMQRMGVQTGLYSFISLERGKESRSGGILHFMKMTTRGGRGVGWRLHRQELYLLSRPIFPRLKNSTCFSLDISASQKVASNPTSRSVPSHLSWAAFVLRIETLNRAHEFHHWSAH
jgi:hypothetical protein